MAQVVRQEKRRRTLQELPVELLAAIVLQLPTFESLKCVAQSCVIPRAVAHEYEEPACKAVVARTLGWDMFRDALAVKESICNPTEHSKFPRWEASKAEAAFNAYASKSHTYAVHWTIAWLTPLFRFHETVEYFADLFANDALPRAEKKLDPTNSTGDQQFRTMPPTGSELQRFQRYFYRFELYRNLFGHADLNVRNYHDNQPAKIFIDSFAPWEVEQLASIYDFLYDKIVPSEWLHGQWLRYRIH